MNMEMTASDMSSEGSHSAGGMVYKAGECMPSQMLWNWHTLDLCFISKTWRITSTGMFAGSCIAVILLTMSLELLRRTAKEYDRKILRDHQDRLAKADSHDDPIASDSPGSGGTKASRLSSIDLIKSRAQRLFVNGQDSTRFRPNLLQQVTRGLLHTLQFAVAYFVMLLAMYYNGYIIFSIFLGAFLGFVVFEWEWVELSTGLEQKEEATSCCG